MMKNLRWIESGLALLTGALFLLTLVNAQWIETIGLDPDAGNGSVERVIVVGLAVVTIAFVSLASYQFGKLAAKAA